MNHISYKNRMQERMFRYINFLSIAQSEFQVNKIYNQKNPTFKLLDEIQYLKFRIIQIDQMTASAAMNHVDFRIDVLESKLNNQ